MNVMKKAWEIAKEGAVKFGGKVKEYFAASLKMAWAQVKNETGAINAQNVNVTIELAEGSKKHKSWVAEIVGTDAKFGFKRQFLNGFEDANVRGLFYKLTDGKVYDVNCAQKGRKFVTVKAGEIVELTQDEVKTVIA